jgi:hypothetical protein
MAVRDSGLHTHVIGAYEDVSEIAIRYLFGPAAITKLQSMDNRKSETTQWLSEETMEAGLSRFSVLNLQLQGPRTVWQSA